MSEHAIYYEARKRYKDGSFSFQFCWVGIPTNVDVSKLSNQEMRQYVINEIEEQNKHLKRTSESIIVFKRIISKETFDEMNKW